MSTETNTPTAVLLTRRAEVFIFCDDPRHKKAHARIPVADFVYVDGNGEGWVNVTKPKKFRRETANATVLRCRSCGPHGVSVALQNDKLAYYLDRIRAAGHAEIPLRVLALGVGQ